MSLQRLFPFQVEGVQFLKEKKYALLASEMGLGKTIQAIVAARDLREEKILVVCPASVKYNWEREINAWDPGASVSVINGSTWKNVPAKYTIINYDLIHRAGIAKHLLRLQFNILILDEAHYLKNSRAKRTKTVYSHNGLADNAVRVWLMTGTPVLNRPVELFPCLRRFMPERLGKYVDYMAFTKRFCAGYQSKWGWDDSGASHLEELASYLDGFMLRRLKKDVMKDLPDKIFQKIVFDAPTAEVKKLVKKEREEYREEMLGAFSSLRQDVGIAKIPMVVEHLTNLLEETDKVIVFAHHRKVLESLKHRLKDYNPVLLYGGLTAQQKQKTVDDFVTDKNKKVFLGQIDAAGIGIDGLQKVANTVVFAEISWVPGQIKQAIDRCHRIGQVNKVLVQFLMMKGGIDEQIYDGLDNKSKVIQKIMVSNLVAKEVGRRIGNIVEPPVFNKEEEIEMAKHSLEDNIERIADALEAVVGRTAPTLTKEEVDSGATPTDPTTDKPTSTPKAAKGKKATPAAQLGMSSQELLAYSNKKVLAIMDPEARKATVQTIVARLKAECGSNNIKTLAPEQVPTAKAIIDETFKALEDEAALL